MTPVLFAGRMDLVATIDGKRTMTPAGIALMLGITVAEVDAVWEAQKATGKLEMPPAWRRRCNELMARHATMDKFKLLQIAVDEQERGRGQG